jgi:hypothetical protein
MAQQTSAIQRKQTTPRPIGRLMDADVSGPFFLVVSKSARPCHSRRNGTCVTAVKEKWRKDSRSIYKARVAHQGPERTGRNRTQGTASVPRVLSQDSTQGA